jgi:hypothetical protein
VVQRAMILLVRGSLKSMRLESQRRDETILDRSDWKIVVLLLASLLRAVNEMPLVAAPVSLRYYEQSDQKKGELHARFDAPDLVALELD